MNIAIVGATGLAGRELLKLIHRRSFRHHSLRLFAGKSAGTQVTEERVSYPVEEITDGMFDGINLAFFAVDGKLALELAPKAVRAGAIVIDKSSAFRMDPRVPLVIPGINGNLAAPQHRIIASPNCSTTIMLTGLWPLVQCCGLKRILVTTFQSISGGGAKLVEKYERELQRKFHPESVVDTIDEFWITRLFDNVIPAIDSFDSNGVSGEEQKMVDETRKILNMPDLPISATCVRVPVMRGHSMQVNIELGRPCAADSARDIISSWRGGSVKLFDDPVKGHYPMPCNVIDQEWCGVGRIRKDQTCENGLALWISGDNLWKGAALNALQIAECLYTH